MMCSYQWYQRGLWNLLCVCVCVWETCLRTLILLLNTAASPPSVHSESLTGGIKQPLYSPPLTRVRRQLEGVQVTCVSIMLRARQQRSADSRPPADRGCHRLSETRSRQVCDWASAQENFWRKAEGWSRNDIILTVFWSPPGDILY